MNYANILSLFDIDKEFVSCEPYGNGHINSTFLAVTSSGEKYILQALNTNVFKKPDEVMSNIYKVTQHLLKREKDRRKVMSIVPLKNGSLFYPDGNKVWRMLDFVKGSVCLQAVENEADFYQCAVAFGNFQRMLGDFDASELYETIPDFHNTKKRYADFLAAVEKDICGRAKKVTKEIEFVKAREDFYSLLSDAHNNGILPLRVTHNDTKINNVLLDAVTRTALCVIDLDTIMPGFSVTDFGDAIRSGATTAAEDEKRPCEGNNRPITFQIVCKRLS